MIHPTATIDPTAVIGAGTRVWHHTQVREYAHIGPSCILGKGVYVDFEVINLVISSDEVNRRTSDMQQRTAEVLTRAIAKNIAIIDIAIL